MLHGVRSYSLQQSTTRERSIVTAKKITQRVRGEHTSLEAEVPHVMLRTLEDAAARQRVAEALQHVNQSHRNILEKRYRFEWWTVVTTATFYASEVYFVSLKTVSVMPWLRLGACFVNAVMLAVSVMMLLRLRSGHAVHRLIAHKSEQVLCEEVFSTLDIARIARQGRRAGEGKFIFWWQVGLLSAMALAASGIVAFV